VSTELQNEFSQYDGLSVVDLVTSMAALARNKEELEDSLKAINKEFDFLRITKIPGQMEDEGIDRITVNGVGRVSLTADMHVSVKAEKKAEFFDWLRDNGRADLISETVNASTLKAAVKGMYKAGEEIPEDLLNVSPFTRASITKA
jgi:hypothetical protein